MAVKFERDKNLLKIILLGEILLEDLYAGVDEIYAGAVPDMVLWDMRNSTAADEPEIGAALQEFSCYAVERGRGRKNGRVALLTSDNVQFGLSRMSSAYAENNRAVYHMRVFREEQPALAWLRREN